MEIAALVEEIATLAQSVLDERDDLEPGAPKVLVTGGLQMSALDSFTVVELVIELEDRFAVSLLPHLVDFTGGTLDEFVHFIITRRGQPDSVRGSGLT